MSILTVFIVLIVVGLILWLVNAYLPIDAKIKTIINVLAVILLIIWLFKLFVAPHLSDVRV